MRLLTTFPLLLLAGSASSAEPVLTFEQQIRPILKAYCLDCHGGSDKPAGGLDLRLKRFALKGGENGPALDLKAPETSLLLERIQSGDMPPGEKKVPADQIAVIAKWLKAGSPTLRPEPEKLAPGLGITAEDRAYWFYQPLVRPKVPQIASPRIHNSIDSFILARLKEKSLDFNPDADRNTLLRRLSFDLTGLPPTVEELRTFAADTSPNAYEKQVDRLLDSAAYGERWGRLWLDAVGYSDSYGDGTTDTVRPEAWRYRDYVIRALNNDKPLNRFIIEQLAGDELLPKLSGNLTPEQIELLSATGYLRMAPDATASGGGAMEAEQVVVDTLKIVSSSLLGSSVGCAQCHDHRYDPISQVDYFRLRAVFEPGLDPEKWRRPAQRRVSLFTDEDRKKSAAIDADAAKMQAVVNEKQTKEVRIAFEKELTKFPEADRPKLKEAFDTPDAKRSAEQKAIVAKNPKLNITPGVLYQYNQKMADEIKKLQDEVNAKRAQRPVENFVSVFMEVPGRVPVTKLHHRGDSRQPKGPDLAPADLTIAATDGKHFEIAPKDSKLPSSGRRLTWATHLTSGEHPLFGRVMANRLWLGHFGQGIVDTPGEFGRLGQLPSHPELLDWLASEFPRQGWSMKKMHRLIVTSTVYRQSSHHVAAKDAVDGANRLYGRYPSRRLDAEMVRDRMLFTTGRLDRTPFGSPIAVVEDGEGQVGTPDNQPRRSVYLQSRRSKSVAFLTTFDAPAGELNCERRESTTTAPQALMLMNGDFTRTQAKHLASLIRTETPAEFASELVAPLAREFPRAAGAWSHGSGDFDTKTARTIDFQPLPHFNGTTWQGAATVPDAKLGWTLLTAQGGHPGNKSAIRRFTAPQAGELRLSGPLAHGSPNGNGVRGRIVSSRSGVLGEWTVLNRSQAIHLGPISVQAGETIDFAVDGMGDVTSDSFSWPVQLTLLANGQTLSFKSVEQFQGPLSSTPLPALVARAWEKAYQRTPSPEELRLGTRFVVEQTRLLTGQTSDPELAALVNFCQQLLASNEFLYVD
jgi:hypothetical protein